MENYRVGEKTWFKGDEITITTEAYEMYGGEFQDGVTESGNTVSIASPNQVQKDVDNSRKEWNDQQNKFKKLKELKELG